MTDQTTARSNAHAGSREATSSRMYGEGIVAGIIGAGTIAIWFLIVDVTDGRPFYTPTVLGTALFRGGAGLASPQTLPIPFEMVFVFTWVHILVFAVIGGVASKLLSVAETTPNLGFGILLLFVVFEFGFIGVSFLISQAVLGSLAWPAVLVGNLLAAATMSGYFWWRHPNLQIEP